MADALARLQPPVMVAVTVQVKVNVLGPVTVMVCCPLIAATVPVVVQPPVPAATTPAIVTTCPVANELIAVVTVTVFPLCVSAVGLYAAMLLLLKNSVDGEIAPIARLHAQEPAITKRE